MTHGDGFSRQVEMAAQAIVPCYRFTASMLRKLNRRSRSARTPPRRHYSEQHERGAMR